MGIMPWWGVLLIGVGACGLGFVVGYSAALLQVGRGFG